MATRSLWRIRAKLAVATTALCTGGAAATIATSEDPAAALKVCTTVPLRLLRDSITAASIVFGTSRTILISVKVLILYFIYSFD